MQPDPKPTRVDLFATRFRPIRQWARYGEPTGKVRPLVRIPGTSLTPEWEPRLWGFEQHLILELRLFGDWLAVSLTSPHAEAQEYLTRWYSASAKPPGWLISERFSPLRTDAGANTA